MRTSSYPYISGDTFLSISDCCIVVEKNKPNVFTFSNKKNIIFIESYFLSIKWVFNIAKTYKVVILHNSDESPDIKLLEELAKNKIYVYGVNIENSKKYIHPIPIGIENAFLGKNGDLNYYNPINLSKINRKKKNILLASFRIETNYEVRIKYELILKSFNYQNKIFRNLKDYREALNNSYYVISPPGNGIDCHRTWEAFYHKTIPVIEKKYFLFKDFDLPVLVVDHIGQFLEYSDQKKLELYNIIINRSYDQIYIQFWINRFQNDIKL